MGSNASTANLAAVGAAVASLIVWALRVALPGPAMESFPEAPAGVLLTWLFCRLVPVSADPLSSRGGL